MTLDVFSMSVVLTDTVICFVLLLVLSRTGDFLSSLLDTLEGKHNIGESKSSESKSSDAK